MNIEELSKRLYDLKTSQEYLNALVIVADYEARIKSNENQLASYIEETGDLVANEYITTELVPSRKVYDWENIVRQHVDDNHVDHDYANEVIQENSSVKWNSVAKELKVSGSYKNDPENYTQSTKLKVKVNSVG